MKRKFLVFLFISLILFALISVTGCRNLPESNQEETGKVGTVVSDGAAVQPTQTAPPFSWEASLPPDIARIKERGYLVVAMYNEDRPPWFYTDKDGQLKGIDVDRAYDIGRLLEVNVKFDRAAKSFNEVVDRVAAGYADIAISKLSVTLTRAQRIRYTQPYIIFHQAILVNRLQLAALQNKNPGQPPLELILNSKGKVGVPKGTSYEEFAQAVFPQAEIIPVPGRQEILEAANRGEVLAALYDEQEIRAFMNENPDYSINVKTFILEDRTDPIAIAVSPKDEQFLAWLNVYLEFAKNDKAIEEILEKEAGRAK